MVAVRNLDHDMARGTRAWDIGKNEPQYRYSLGSERGTWNWKF